MATFVHERTTIARAFMLSSSVYSLALRANFREILQVMILNRWLKTPETWNKILPVAFRVPTQPLCRVWIQLYAHCQQVEVEYELVYRHLQMIKIICCMPLN